MGKGNISIAGSFRDPSGFLFFRDGLLYRQVNIGYKRDYDCLMSTGLYKTLINAGLLIPHEEVNVESPAPNRLYKIIKPELIPFISYPYEWCFSQLKDAALTTLKIQKISFEYGLILKDCSAYNIQFRKGKPIFIDTLSFAKYHEGLPWVAYKQFCQHFLATLALLSYKDIRLSQLLRIYLDGIPLDLASSLLPFRTRFIFSLLTHIHFHSKFQEHFAGKSIHTAKKRVTRFSLLGLFDSLETTVKNLKWKAGGTEWSDYYRDTNYSSEAFRQKGRIISEFLDKVNPMVVWDLGANTGVFSRIAGNIKRRVISLDIDPASVEKNYLQCVADNETNILPLLSDFINPPPGIGWNNEERASLIGRGPADTALALALIHHLAISNNLPFSKIVDFFSRICNSLIIEFVPKEDSQVQRLLLNREDIFIDYDQKHFEFEFEKCFQILGNENMEGSKRTLYLMKKRIDRI